MDTNPFNIADIIAKHFRNEPLDSREQQALDIWIQSHPKNKLLFDELIAQSRSMKLDWLDNLDEESAWQRIEKKRGKKRRKQFVWRVAATIALIFSFCLSLWIYEIDFTSSDKQNPSSPLNMSRDDVSPAILGAKIILANGQEVKVDDTLNIALGTPIIGDDLTPYNELSQEEPIFHKLIVPAANFFKITLTDGTAVWVNAASELRFPERFGDAERRVYLKGE